MNDSTTHTPDGAWEFDEEVTACFDDMLARSIPQYDLMRQLVFRLQKAFMQDGKRIIDLGSSRGGAITDLYDSRGDSIKYTLVERSKPMRDVLRDKFGESCFDIRDYDLRYSFPHHQARMIQSVLTLQFVPINYRQQILERAYQNLEEGGAFVLVEKVLGVGAVIDDIFKVHYHALKNENGYSYESIERKSSSLEGVLVPVTSDWNVQMLKETGFSHVDCFWRYLNFAGWVAVK